MELSELKPILVTLVLPPGGPILLALLGMALMLKSVRTGMLVTFVGLALLWFLSCNAVSVELARTLIPQVQPITREQLQSVQAIVVLGGGVHGDAPEYGAAQPSSHTLDRLRYGVALAKASGKPLGFAGGVGWAAQGTGVEPEGAVARRIAQQEYGVQLRWVDDRSRDTEENARLAAQLLRRDAVKRVALVTSAFHMPRSVRAFRRAGLEVVAAPTAFIGPRERPVMEALPSAEGLAAARHVIREWLALMLT